MSWPGPKILKCVGLVQHPKNIVRENYRSRHFFSVLTIHKALANRFPASGVEIHTGHFLVQNPDFRDFLWILLWYFLKESLYKLPGPEKSENPDMAGLIRYQNTTSKKIQTLVRKTRFKLLINISEMHYEAFPIDLKLSKTFPKI